MTNDLVHSRPASGSAWQICMLTMMAAAIFLMPDLAFAGADPLGKPLETIKGWFTGTAGTAIATIGVIIVGIGALLGKVSWGMALIVAIGVAVVFGADAIVKTLK